MSYSYTLPFADDSDRVRFHLGDTEEASARFSDEEIAAVLAEYGSYQTAVIALLQNLIAKLAATPDFQADWLSMDSSRSVAGYKELLAEKRRQFGISAVRGTSKAVYRSDSLQTEAPEDW